MTSQFLGIFMIYTTSCNYSKFAIIYIFNRGVLKYHKPLIN